MRLDDKQREFIGSLLRLAEESKKDRGALADLRSGLGKEPGKMARVHKYVVPYLPKISDNDRWYYVTATLFGLFPKHRKGYSLGAAFHPLAFPPKEPKKDSMEARFVALLNAHPDDLDGHLRHVIRLLESAKPAQPFDWFRFFQDLLQWDHPDGHVQLRWARDFYKGDSINRIDVLNSDLTVKKEEQGHE